MIKLKHGVSLFGLSPQAALGMYIVDGAFTWYGEEVCTITSVSDFVVGRVAKSLHPHGRAFDVRLPVRSMGDIEKIVAMCRGDLGPQFDVVLKEDHIHFEWDPKS